MRQAEVIFKIDKSSSFPSRSAIIAQYLPMAFFIWYYSPLKASVLSGVFCAASSFSRMYLGAHYFSDCLFSYLYGVPLIIFTKNIYTSEIWMSTFTYMASIDPALRT